MEREKKIIWVAFHFVHQIQTYVTQMHFMNNPKEVAVGVGEGNNLGLMYAKPTIYGTLGFLIVPLDFLIVCV